jgi:hypothetical protein
LRLSETSGANLSSVDNVFSVMVRHWHYFTALAMPRLTLQHHKWAKDRCMVKMETRTTAASKAKKGGQDHGLILAALPLGVLGQIRGPETPARHGMCPKTPGSTPVFNE